MSVTLTYPVLADNYALSVANNNNLLIQTAVNELADSAEIASVDLGNPNSNLGTITIHKTFKRNGVCEYKLAASSGTWTAGTSYTVAVLDSTYRPIAHVREERRISDIAFGYFFISSTTGEVTITPRTSISNSSLAIDKTFITA